jgi:hypothetical protein
MHVAIFSGIQFLLFFCGPSVASRRVASGMMVARGGGRKNDVRFCFSDCPVKNEFGLAESGSKLAKAIVPKV